MKVGVIVELIGFRVGIGNMVEGDVV